MEWTTTGGNRVEGGLGGDVIFGDRNATKNWSRPRSTPWNGGHSAPLLGGTSTRFFFAP